MARLKQILIAGMITTVCVGPLFAQGQQASQTNGDQDYVRLQDGSCNQSCLQDGTCDGPGSQRRGGQGRHGGRSNGWKRGSEQGLNCFLVGDVEPLTEEEILSVEQLRQEEKLARDVYQTLNETWLSDVLARIATSEQRHMDAIANIIALQNLEDPIPDDIAGSYRDQNFVDLYNGLTEQGSPSYIEALKVGAYIEELDIVDLQTSLLDVSNVQLTRVFNNLMRGSRNHLRAFVRELAIEGVSYHPQILSQEQYDLIITAGQERGNGNGRMGRGQRVGLGMGSRLDLNHGCLRQNCPQATCPQQTLKSWQY